MSESKKLEITNLEQKKSFEKIYEINSLRKSDLKNTCYYVNNASLNHLRKYGQLYNFVNFLKTLLPFKVCNFKNDL